MHKTKALSARGKAKQGESEESEKAHYHMDSEGLNYRRDAKLVMEGNSVSSPASAPVSLKAVSSSSHATRPEFSGVSGPQKVSDDPLQAVERFMKTEADPIEDKRNNVQSQIVEIENKPESRSTSVETKQKSIQFKDAVGRSFEFPFLICKTWLVGGLIFDSNSLEAEQ